MVLTAENYYSKEANKEYMSVSQYKDFAGTYGKMACEFSAIEKLEERWAQKKTTPLLVGSYVDSYFEGTLEEFKKENPEMFVDRFIIWSRARKVKEVWRYMERQSEQELLAIVPVETESLEGNRIYQVTGRELTQIAEISAREAVKMCREERKKTEKREQSNADKVKRTKKLLSDYRRLKREIPENEEFTEGEKVEKRWAFLRDLMGSAHINSQESVVEKEEKRRAENMYYINRIERAIETYREECETSKKPEAMRCYREVYEYYIAEEEKTVAQIASEECVSEKTVYKDIGNACKIIAVYLLGV